MKLHCCEMTCEADAEFEIRGRTNHPEDYTHSCTEHVGELLTDLPDLEPVVAGWQVIPLAVAA